MFNPGDRVRVVKDEFDSEDLVGKEGVVHIVDNTQESTNVVVVLEDFEPNELDIMMSSILGYPHNAIPFNDSELELI